MTYDSAEVRRAAQKILACANSVNQSAAPKVRSVRNDVDDSFEGAAANALKNRLSDIDADIRTIVSGLNLLHRALMTYAEALEEADRKIAESL